MGINTEVNYSISGNGPVIIWLHGFLESKTIWENQTSFFNSHYTNICIDLLGHGETNSIANIHTVELQATAVISVINQLKINQFSVVGHSMGGYVGLSLLKMLPSQITHFVLVNSTSFPDNLEKKQNRERAIKIVASQKDNFIRMGIVNLFSTANRKQFSTKIEALIAKAQQMTPKAIIAALNGMKNRKSSLDILTDFSGKKMIIAGIHDPVITLEDSRKEASLTQSQFLEIKGGHMSYLEASTILNTVLFSFFKD